MRTSEPKINLACGDTYVEGDGWINLDYRPSGAAVRQADLLGRLPIADQVAALVYSSHFLEHIPYDLVQAFLSECYRILKPGGVLRLVLPDMENLCQAYLAHRERGEHTKADFVVMEMIDQCVRQVSGGELGRFYKHLKTMPLPPTEMIEFIRDRTGEVLEASLVERKRCPGWGRLWLFARTKLQRLWVLAVLQLLPAAFRAQNVSLAAVGERHQWLWDFHMLQTALVGAGFTDIVRCTADTSSFVDFPFRPLDLDYLGRPRKGQESMYIEAIK